MQASSDIFLGWLHVKAGAGRQPARFLRPPAQGLEGLGGDRSDDARAGMAIYGRLCGWTLARAHARSGDRIAIASYLGRRRSFDRGDPRVLARLRGPERAATTRSSPTRSNRAGSGRPDRGSEAHMSARSLWALASLLLFGRWRSCSPSCWPSRGFPAACRCSSASRWPRVAAWYGGAPAGVGATVLVAVVAALLASAALVLVARRGEAACSTCSSWSSSWRPSRPPGGAFASMSSCRRPSRRSTPILFYNPKSGGGKAAQVSRRR